MPSPTWLAAVTGQLPLAQQPNALQVTHPSVLLYTATAQDANSSASGGTVSSATGWNAQKFVTTGAQTAVGYVVINASSNASFGSQLGPWTVSIYTNAGGAPGVPIVSTTVTTEYVSNFSSLTALAIPTPCTGLTPSTTYWIVTNQVVSTFRYQWVKNVLTSGASTSSNGTSWTAQAYGLTYTIYDQSAIQPLLFTYDDGGLAWNWYGRDVENRIEFLGEYVAGQTTAGYIQGVRTFEYSNGLITRLI